MHALLNILARSFSKNAEYARVLSILADRDASVECTVSHLRGGAKGLFLGQLFADVSENMLVVSPTKHSAERLYHDVRACVGDAVVYFPEWEVLPYDSLSPFYDIVHHRIEVLHAMLRPKKVLVITPLSNFVKTLIPKSVFQQECCTITKGMTLKYDEFLCRLQYLGYTREARVDQPGVFSVKGGIVDVFPSSSSDPVRVEFYEDMIESVRVFDVSTQLSKAPMDVVDILPQKELLFTEKSIERACRHIRERFSHLKTTPHILEQIQQKQYFQGIEQLLPFFYERERLLHYFDTAPIVVYDEYEDLQKQSTALHTEWQELYEHSHKSQHIKASPKEFLEDFQAVCEQVDVCLNVSEQYSSRAYSVMNIRSVEGLSGSVELFKKELQAHLKSGHCVLVLARYDLRTQHLESLLKEFEPITHKTQALQYLQDSSPGLIIHTGDLSQGFRLVDEKIVVILDCELLGHTRRVHKKLRKVRALPIEDFYDVQSGDYVVHINHGISLYKGLERIEAAGKTRDFIVLLFADNEKLYVPIEQLEFIQKYIGPPLTLSHLDKLGGKSWEKRKAKVQKSLEEVARELVEIYSARKNLTGYAFPKDSQWQASFEASFLYEETPDQLRATAEVKQDMESSSPMDRLICGDVGYGKTEVAVRAVFKAVMAGKQVAFLVPTTILCEQHFRTLQERFASYPIKVAMLSRVERAEQRSVIKALASGDLDIVIGTHRLISKDVHFKNLGLVVIDEEQRFGVRHKERLKSLRKLVDVLSMSATPIPRTLHMSLVKIRDMSAIETPPDNRFAVETYVMEFHEDMVKDALHREFQRDGQAYFIFNRVKHIKSFARYLQELVPEAKVCVVHGQMEAEDAERVLLDFIARKYNVLVCTSILESGIDIPNVNTILIDRADRFGLAQLYQLKGRVGRSDRKAYCYLFYPEGRVLSEIAQRRLTIIHEYTDLGSGFQIAMKDMELRGAGNVLGFEQSGNIVSVGFEFYCKLLDEAVQRHSDPNPLAPQDVHVDLRHDMYIPDDYIPDEKQRIEVYKKIAALIAEDEVQVLKGHLKDRFGDLPETLLALLSLAELRILAKRLAIVSIVETASANAIVFEFQKRTRIQPEKILTLPPAYTQKLRIDSKDKEKLYFSLESNDLTKKVHLIKDFVLRLT